MQLNQEVVDQCKEALVEVERDGYVFNGKTQTFLLGVTESGDQCAIFSILLVGMKKKGEGPFPAGFRLGAWINARVNTKTNEPRFAGPHPDVAGGNDGVRFNLPEVSVTFYPKGEDRRAIEEEERRGKVIEHNPATAK